MAEQGKHVFAAVETRLGGHRARKMQRQLHASGYKAWFSRAKEPTSVGAPPRGRVMIAARNYIRARRVGVRSGLGAAVDAELEKHVIAVHIHAKAMQYTVYALHRRPSVGVEGNWSALSALARAVQAERGEWLVLADWNSGPDDLEAAGWLGEVGGSLVLPRGAAATMVRQDAASLIDFGVVSRGLACLLLACEVGHGAPRAPHLPLNVEVRAALSGASYQVLGRAPALWRLLEARPRAPGALGAAAKRG